MTKHNTTVYDWKGFRIKTLKEEVCYFEIAHLIKNDCGLDDVRRIWYKKRGILYLMGEVKLKMIKISLPF